MQEIQEVAGNIDWDCQKSRDSDRAAYSCSSWRRPGRWYSLPCFSHCVPNSQPLLGRRTEKQHDVPAAPLGTLRSERGFPVTHTYSVFSSSWIFQCSTVKWACAVWIFWRKKHIFNFKGFQGKRHLTMFVKFYCTYGGHPALICGTCLFSSTSIVGNYRNTSMPHPATAVKSLGPRSLAGLMG